MSQTDTNEKLSEKQLSAIEALLKGETVTDAAKAAGVGRATLTRWQDEDDFKAARKEAEKELIAGTTSRLVSLSKKAALTLESIIDDLEAAPTVRVRAALGILDAMLKVREAYELEERLTVLEERIDNEH